MRDDRFSGTATERRRAHPSGAPGSGRSYDTAELFGGATEIEIVHNEAVYRLKITRQGKLILNK